MTEEQNSEQLNSKNQDKHKAPSPFLSGVYKEWFLDYASYVILERAVPNLKDGLKPVQRRILHSMKEMEDGRYNKVANVIGNTMKYHPHGDASIGDALVQLGQKDFLIDCQGNWGNIFTGDRSAASRYIEARLNKLALDVVFNPKTTNWLLSYDGRNKEPDTLPVKFPLLLLQGVEGIAVGLACKILPHNFIELIDSSIKVLKGKDFEIYPDFPTAGLVDVSNYKQGLKGEKIRVRANIEVIDKNTLSITELPFSTTTTSLIESILKANAKGKIKIKKVEDNTADQVDIRIYLPAGVSSQVSVDALYAFTDCELGISPNACVIDNDKPVFMGIKEILKKNTNHTLSLLQSELEIKKYELEEKWQQLSLDKLFIEHKVYVKLHGLGYEEAITLTYNKMIELTRVIKLFRPIDNEDIVRLLEIRMRRITKHDSDQVDSNLLDIEKSMQQTNYDLDHIVDYTISYYRDLNKKYGKGRERKTKITTFDTIKVSKVAANNTKLYVNKKEGFVGYELNKKEADFICDCSDIDDIICISKDGQMSVTKIQKKSFVFKNIVYINVWEKGDDRTIYNLIYRNGKQGESYMKRFAVTSITRDTIYSLTKGELNSKILYLSINHNGEAEVVEVRLKPNALIRKLIFDVDFSKLKIKSRSAMGNLMTKKTVQRVTLKKSGESTLSSLQYWYEKDTHTLNTNGTGQYLGRYTTGEKLIEITHSGSLRILSPDILLRFDENTKSLIKYNPNQIITIIYFDGNKQHYFIKRIKAQGTHKFTPFITNHPQSKLLDISLNDNPKVKIMFSNKDGRARLDEEYSVDELVSVKGFSALGNRLSRYEIKHTEFIEEPNGVKKVNNTTGTGGGEEVQNKLLL